MAAYFSIESFVAAVGRLITHGNEHVAGPPPVHSSA
jgi:hypothetical protein